MRYVILGMLLGGPLSLYELRKRFEQVVSLFYSASFGSLQRALGVLHDAGLVRAQTDAGSPRGRRPYEITPTGRAAWEEWMRGPLQGAESERIMLTKVFFLGRLDDPAARTAILTGIRERLDADLARLEDLAAATSPASEPVAAYPVATLDYGTRSLALARTWLDELIRAEDGR